MAALEIGPDFFAHGPRPQHGQPSRRRRRTMAILGSAAPYSSRLIQQCTAHPAVTTHCATRSLCLRSSPRFSGAPATLWLALERLFTSPCPSVDTLSCAGRLFGPYAVLAEHLRPADALEIAPKGLWHAQLRWAGRGCHAGCCNEYVMSRLVSAVWIECCGDPGGYRYLGLMARVMLCGR